MSAESEALTPVPVVTVTVQPSLAATTHGAVYACRPSGVLGVMTTDAPAAPRLWPWCHSRPAC